MAEKIVTFADRFGARSLHEHALRNPSFLGDRTPPADGVVLSPSVAAFVNGGRWIAQCPSEGCNGCEYVNVDELLFFCCECRNSEWGHIPLLVTMPDAKTAGQVQAYLGVRPAWQTRNWHPSEPITLLRAENRAHGIRLERNR